MQMRDVIRFAVFLLRERKLCTCFPTSIHFIPVGYIGILMSLHRTCYKFQRYLSSTVNLWTIRALNGQCFFCVAWQLRQFYFRQRNKKRAKRRNSVTKTWKNRTCCRPICFLLLLFIFRPLSFAKRSFLTQSCDHISCHNEPFHFISCRCYLLRNHIFYGALVIIHYYCLSPLGKLTAT